jgi:cysteine desulfurase
MAAFSLAHASGYHAHAPQQHSYSPGAPAVYHCTACGPVTARRRPDILPIAMIYLDHNATTPLLPEVAEAMRACAARSAGNPSSQHAFGRRARQALEDAREGIARLVGADLDHSPPDQIIFTSGGTEANNLVMFGLIGDVPGHLLISPIEHPSITASAEVLAGRGWQVERLPLLPTGVVDLGPLADLLRPSTRLVSVMLANNETGVLQPVEEIARICQRSGVLTHTDAVQVPGKLPLDFRRLGVGTMTIAAHKFHGPVGIGALVLRAGLRLQPQLYGGHQQAGLRPGTEPVVLAVGLHAALVAWQREHDARLRRLTSLRDRLEQTLLSAWPELKVNGAAAPRLPHTSNISFPGVEGQALLMALDLAGIACSTGSACASGASEGSPTLLAMGVEKSLGRSSLRFSLGATTTEEEVVEAADRILRTYNELRQGK